MHNRLTRRALGGLLVSGASLAVLASTPRSAHAETRLRLLWWGNPDRDRRTKEVVDLYKQVAPDVTVDLETYPWSDYWNKLATQAAGRNIPDVIQMDYRYIFEYARRGQLANLSPYVGYVLKLGDYDKGLLDTGKIGDRLYGVSNGANSIALVYDKTKLDELGVKPPDPTKWTYEELVALGNDLKPKLGDLKLISNNGDTEPWLDNWVRQRGKTLYTADGKLGYALEDLESFWEFWFKLQEAGLTPAPDVQAQDDDSGLDKMMLVQGHSLFDFTNSNQLVAVQKLVKDQVDLTMMPNQEGNRPGQYLKPSMFFSMSASSADPEAAAALLNFFITDPKAADILLIERGVPGSASIRAQIAPKLNEVEKRMLDYLSVVATHVSPTPPPPPSRAGELDRALRPAWQAIAFGRTSVSDGAKDFYSKAEATLERA